MARVRVAPRLHVWAVAILAIIFLFLALWNVGDRHTPVSNWTPLDKSEEVYLDLGSVTRVDMVLLFLQDAGAMDMDVYAGSPGNWIIATHIGGRGWSEAGILTGWREIEIERNTRYIRFLVHAGSDEIGEIAVFSDTGRLEIKAVEGDRGGDVYRALVDEQYLINDPTSRKSVPYFDETVFVRTAEEHLRLEEPTEDTHPPLGKLMIAAGMALFGHNPLGWRIASVVVGALMIPLMYLLARRLFASSRAGLVAALLLTFDSMHFAEARLATADTFVLFFVMAMFYSFHRYTEDPSRGGRYLFASLVFFGFGFATKWVVVFGLVGIVLLLIARKWRKPITRNEILWLTGGLAAAAVIYLLSYVPYFLAGHGFTDFVSFQLSMFRFHAELDFSHGYGSEWWTWPLLLRPMWIYFSSVDMTASYIVLVGNPALWWASIPAVLFTSWVAIRHRSWVALFIVVPFFSQWLVFAFISRILFIYHLYPNVLFMILAMTFCIEYLWKKQRWSRPVVGAYLALNVACFAFFFPAISGFPMAEEYWRSLGWLVNWLT